MSSKTEYESYLTGVDEERERIIKLLEDSHCPLPEKWHLENLQTCFGYCGNNQDYIAFIKGEN